MPTTSEAPRLDQSAQNAHRDIRQKLFQALDMITAREVVAEVGERGWLSMVRDQLNNAVCWTADAERAAMADAMLRAREVKS